jgi:hypothetical protein
MLNVSNMNRLNRVTSLIVMALWLSCLVHCGTAKLMGAGLIACCGEVSNDGGETPVSGHCVCDLTKTGVFLATEHPVALPPAAGIEVFKLFSSLEVRPLENLPAQIISSPPDLPACWQFVFRTASPPRAPSFVS